MVKQKKEKKPIQISDIIIADSLVFARATSRTTDDTYPVFFNFNTGEGSCRCQAYFFNDRCEHLKALLLSINGEHTESGEVINKEV